MNETIGTGKSIISESMIYEKVKFYEIDELHKLSAIHVYAWSQATSNLTGEGIDFLTHYMLIFQREHKHIFTFYVITPHWWDIGT